MTSMLTTPTRLRKSREASETRFKWFGRGAIALSLAFLVFMVGSIILQGKGALTTSEIAVTVDLSADNIDPNDIEATSFDSLMKKSLRETFPEVTSRGDKRKLYGLLSVDLGFELRDQIIADPSLLGGPQKLWFTASDDADLVLSGTVDRNLDEENRRMSDLEISWLETLEQSDSTNREFNTKFFTNGDSREPELAGILSALMGSILTLSVCFFVSFPIAILAAIYLEEFAPKNRLSQFIEVNINNLAAVPSIVFGLLGLAMLLNTFGLPRSTPLVGGLVLSLMTLPTIIIAARASLRAVPPSIREAALGMGASPVQATFHHVAPLALPGILTGTIVGMAQALGETAPLLMIGMVAFIADVPSSIVEPAAALPVQIFLWADASERAFVEKTSAAIIVLLVFLVLMNLMAIYLRKKFEKRF
ncbi:phosphate transport system permease protein PstA [Amylibacter ulvae]|uniref:Phosphate transport system permease protein PstA n=1 Tax=Paramylibacter ulvae TaxID=1651968 RepID=A0ABQ3CVW8_9RHOB|nr:phosphate ABC transporter permease PstA [Amylibacter ulvae]GHA44887.1 phosphate transport system permease protein PstA [Amylibacter ulvae]